jgi:alanine racemase
MPAQYTVQQIASWIGEDSSLQNPSAVISTLSIDSRKLVNKDNVLFFAIKGVNHDGHQYIPGLLEEGVRNFVVSDISFLKTGVANIIYAPNVVKALQALASKHREAFSFPLLAITGSNGKTIIKEWLSELLKADYNVVKSPRSYNSQVGVPLSVWQIQSSHNIGVFEAGISMPGEMRKLERILRPDWGLFTNLGDAHSENFTNKYNKALEKAELFKNCSRIFYRKDHELIHEVVTHVYPNTETVTWGEGPENNLQVSIGKSYQDTKITGVYKGENLELTVPFMDKGSIENICHCWLICLEMGLDSAEIKKRIEQLSPIAMRLEVKRALNGSMLVNDVYNADLGSLEIALDVLNRQTEYSDRVLILSDILQSGLTAEQLCDRLNVLIQRFNIQKFIGIGPVMQQMHAFLEAPSVRTFQDTESFLRSFHRFHFEKCALLVKGARPFRLERVCQRIEERVHETRMEINLNAVVNNLNHFRKQLTPNTKLMAMVKASSYGSGSIQIAKLLSFHRVDYLAVAYADEGIELRDAGVSLPIMVMSPEMKGFDQMVHNRLEPEIYNFKMLEAFRRNLNDTEPELLPFPVHIMLDTGMKRLGFEEHEIEALAYELKATPGIRIASVLSHLAGADDAIHDSFTERQIQRFNEMYARLSEIIGYKPMKHILNSAGISRHPQAQFDMVRLGIGLYGVARTEDDRKKLEPVISLKSEIIQMKEVKAGESVGYGRQEIAAKNMITATVSLGYADGLARRLGNRRSYLLVNGNQAPIVGNICMDMCMIDITNIEAEVGTEVEVFGVHRSLTDFAKELDTIPYEVLTSVPPRVKRIYFQE